jgi:hypothetical protein
MISVQRGREYLTEVALPRFLARRCKRQNGACTEFLLEFVLSEYWRGKSPLSLAETPEFGIFPRFVMKDIQSDIMGAFPLFIFLNPPSSSRERLCLALSCKIFDWQESIGKTVFLKLLYNGNDFSLWYTGHISIPHKGEEDLSRFIAHKFYQGP